MKFEIKTMSTVHVIHINPRAEKHGGENVPAVDLKLRMETSNVALSMFHPELMQALYYSSESKRAQNHIEGVEPVAAPNRVFEKLLPLRWRDEGTGYTLRIDHGLGGQSDLVLGDCTISDFAIDPKEGGTVGLTWRLQCTSAGERELGKLAMLTECDVKATLTQSENDGVLWPFPGTRSADDQVQRSSAAAIEPAPPPTVTTRKRRTVAKDGAKDASQVFVEQHAQPAKGPRHDHR